MTDEQPTLFVADIEPMNPVLPYGGTSGWAGSETSRERAEAQDTDGTTSRRQTAVLRYLKEAGYLGMTWVEVAGQMDLHHGAASGVLSTLHKAGHISRLSERRGKCQVYVHNDYVADRTTVAYKPNVSARLLEEVLNEVLTDLGQGRVEWAKARIAVTLQHLNG
jgi:hypothetical protein